MLIRSESRDSGIALDLTPMIDMVFLLLIFFLAATTFQQAERELHIALPTADAALPISAALREIVVNVDAQGRMVVGGREVEPEALREMVAEALRANPEQKVTIRGDKSAPYSHIVRALDACKAAGIDEPYLDTVPVG